MKMLRIPLLMMGLLLCSQGFAATAQQNKMTTCNAEATTETIWSRPTFVPSAAVCARASVRLAAVILAAA